MANFNAPSDMRSTFQQLRMYNALDSNEPLMHYLDTHSPAQCCINAPLEIEAEYHKNDRSKRPLTWSNISCEYEKALYQNDPMRIYYCEEFLKKPSTLRPLGMDRLERMSNRFNLDFLKERIAAFNVTQAFVENSASGLVIGHYALLVDFNFVDYLDRRAAISPQAIDITAMPNFTLLSMMKWAHFHDEVPTLDILEGLLLSPRVEAYFNEHMLLHLANRFDFPVVRMCCMSSLRSLEDIDEYKADPNYQLHLSDVDRELIEKRAEIFKKHKSEGTSLPDDFFYRDVHSGGRTFSESISIRYDPSSYLPGPMEFDTPGFNFEVKGIEF